MTVTTTNTQDNDNPTETVEALLKQLNKKREQDKGKRGKRVSRYFSKNKRCINEKRNAKRKSKKKSKINVVEDENPTSTDNNKDEIAAGQQCGF